MIQLKEWGWWGPGGLKPVECATAAAAHSRAIFQKLQNYCQII